MSVISKLLDIATSKSYYFDCENLLGSEGRVTAQVKGSAIVILRAKSYFVDTHWFPDVGRNLNKLVKTHIKYNNPINADKVIWRVLSSEAGKSNVAMFYIPNDVVESVLQKVEYNVALIPEELLIERLGAEKIKLSFQGSILNTIKFGESANNHSVFDTLVAKETNTINVDSVKIWSDLLLKSFHAKDLLLVGQLIKKKNRERLIPKLEGVTTGMLACCAVYIIVSFLFVEYQKIQISAHLDEQRELLKTLADNKVEFEQKKANLDLLSIPFGSKPTKTMALSIIAEAYNQADFRLEQLTYTRSGIVIKGKTENAVAVFEALTNNSKIENVRYVNPTFQRGRYATFNIGFNIKEGA